ncbi:Dual specificity protein phosphatase 1-B [Psilocybe cubensis]|uniref:Dual specificity protein phosphatase 1-B n=2 Tax=Psilocybe cubensis TaxID=181762 RepID=A0ACB8GNJ4_PSICU|nr:Dual specificity protein phosphatase 1-B [Psilocybe cubensis]KAH9476977.1 Dual specificity protein phosphatase 1-B [Psilocybe cubensis]
MLHHQRPPVHNDTSTTSEDDDDDDDNDVFEDTLQLSDSDSSNPSSPTGRAGPSIKLDEPLPDDITKDLEALQQLRQSVKKNLRLRPIRSRTDLRKLDLDLDSIISRSASFTAAASPAAPPLTALSPTSSIASSYFTPSSDTPQSALFSAIQAPRPSPMSPPVSLAAQTLASRLIQPKRPLLIDTRPLAAHQSYHLRHSINIAIPSLILKRCRRPGGGLQSLDALRQFTTTELGKIQWDALMCPGGPWDGDVVVYDDEMDPKDKDNLGITAWAIIPVISPLLTYGSVAYLEGGLSIAGHHPELQALVTTADELDSISDMHNNSIPPPLSTTSSRGGMKRSAGLLQLDTQAATRLKKLPEIELASTTSSKPPSPLPISPLPIMSSMMTSSSSSSSSQSISTADAQPMDVVDASPSPPPSSIGFRRPAPPRRPNLRRIDTKSAERLGPPKLSVRTKQMRSATLAVPPTLSLSIQAPPQSPSHLNLLYSTHSPPPSARYPMTPSTDPANYLTPYYTPPHTPGTPKPVLPPSPITARPDLDPPTTEDAFPVFTISTILPNFLFLGPELTAPEHVAELQALGVKRILNIAAECDDDHGLRLREVFDKYYKIPMRDTVEEDNISRGVREVCDILDDARLHSAATYVHCKAGKSRSVTAVMAYLIHANHWTLSSAYAFVLERRKGISPNIGFVSELMNFEEQELGGKSVGVQPTLSNPSHHGHGHGANGAGTGGEGGGGGGGIGLPESYVLASGASRRSGAHVRESLPPMDTHSGQLNGLGGGVGGAGGGGPMSAGGIMDRVLGDSGQEMEIKDSYGRYRHARRAPVDETTLQPMRRVSKAGLESASWS